MNQKKDLSALTQHLTYKNLALAGTLAISAYGIYSAFRKNLKAQQVEAPPKYVLPVTYKEFQLWDTLVFNTKYNLTLVLLDKSTYQGRCQITFDLKEIPEDLFLAFQSNTINAFTLNGHALPQKTYIRNQRIYLPSHHLKTEGNIVEVSYINEYSTVPDGLYRHHDYDDLPYVYINSEPFSAHSVFPCFDSVASRGNFKLKVICDQSWTVISNESVKHVENIGPDNSKLFLDWRLEDNSSLKIVEFYETRPIMSYIFEVSCGPFHKVKPAKRYRNVESSFYCKKSIAHLLDQQNEELSDLLFNTLEYFEEYFDIKYPFSKLDFVFYPDYISEGMEKPGAISFCDEGFLLRNEATYEDKVRRGYIVLHEIAHMWFGNLVAIKGNNETWLKESFASFFGYLGMRHPKTNIQIPDGWDDIDFYKEDGVRFDCFKTLRHPFGLEPFKDSSGAIFNYDHINYEKGSGVLKVLWARLGEELFRDVMRDFLAKNQWKSVEKSDLYNSIKTVTDQKPLNHWVSATHFIENWFEVEGTDTIEVVREGDQLSLRVHRDPPNSQRDHYFKACLLYTHQEREVHTVYIPGNTDTVSLVPQEGLKAVILNYEGLSLFKAKLDQATIDYFVSSLQDIRTAEPKLETMFWRQLTVMVEQFDFNSEAFIAIVKMEFADSLEGNNKPLHKRLLEWTKSALEFVNPDGLAGLKKYIAEEVYKTIENNKQEDKNLDLLELLADNADQLQQFEFALQHINRNLLVGIPHSAGYKNVGVSLIKRLLQQKFAKQLFYAVDHFFSMMQKHDYEEIQRLKVVFKRMKEFEKHDLRKSEKLLDNVMTKKIMEMKIREKSLLWSLVKERYSETFESDEYKEVFFKRAYSITQQFHKFDVFEIFDHLFPEYDFYSQEAIDSLEGLKNKFKNQEIVLHYIDENLDHLRHVFTHQLPQIEQADQVNN